METRTYTVYKFSELSEDGKEKAIQNLSTINVDYDWWSFTYEDAKTIGLEITEFDLDRNRHANGKFTLSAPEVADKITEGHGDTCETYKVAKQFLKDRDALVAKYSDGVSLDRVSEDNEDEFDAACDCPESDFLQALLECYATMLQEECDYLMSSEAIIETIEANEYDFTEYGKLD